MSHTPPIYLDRNTKTVAYYSLEKPKNLVVFVHGFGGKSTGTWDDFPELIHSHIGFDSSDVIFYGYKSLKYQANVSAIRFREFLLENFSKANVIRNAEAGLSSENFKYEKIVLVAHSLGAVVVRRALLFISNMVMERSILDITSMVLFAPAHRGTLIKDSWISELPGLLSIAGTMGILAVPVLRNLQPSSGTIRDLISDTNTLRGRDAMASRFTIAKSVVWAEREIVVFQDLFDPNEEPHTLKDTHHTSVCKPVANYFLKPLEFVTAELQ